MQVKVKALQNGFYNNMRVREGSVFFLGEDAFRKDKNGGYLKDEQGNVIFPKWVELVETVQASTAPRSRRTKEVVQNTTDEVI